MGEESDAPGITRRGRRQVRLRAVMLAVAGAALACGALRIPGVAMSLGVLLAFGLLILAVGLAVLVAGSALGLLGIGLLTLAERWVRAVAGRRP